MSEKTSLALIVPCYNEASSIPFFEKELESFYGQLRITFPGIKLQVVVVENNSTDGSSVLLEGLAVKYSFLRVEKCSIQGYGAALKHGFAAATGHYLAFLDLDNTYPMAALLEMLEMIQNENLDIIYGVRLHSHSDISPVRKLGNLLYVWLLKIFFNSKLSDVCSGMRIFRAERLSEIVGLHRNDLSFSIEFTAHALVKKWKISEFPIHYRDRVGESKLSILKDGFMFMAVVFQKALKRK